MHHIKSIGVGILVFVFVVGLMILSWMAERKVSWKLSYGGKVDKKIEQLEERIEALEAFHEE